MTYQEFTDKLRSLPFYVWVSLRKLDRKTFVGRFRLIALAAIGPTALLTASNKLNRVWFGYSVAVFLLSLLVHDKEIKR